MLSHAEKDALIAELLKRIEGLEARLDGSGKPPKTPRNSSKPPSSGQKASESVTPRKKRNPHPGAHRRLHPNPTERCEVPASLCNHCNADVSAVAQAASEVYDRIEIPPITPDVTRVSLFGGVCPCCAKKFKAPAPAGLEPGSPFGPNLRALVIYLRFHQFIPLARLKQTLFDLLGLEISEGSLVNILRNSKDAFATQVERFKDDLLAGSVIASDETGLRVGKISHWLWVFHHADTAIFTVDQRRGKDVVKEFLGDYRPDYWISDRLAAQLGWAKIEHQACLAHLIRDAQYAIDAGDKRFAPAIKELLKRACGIGARREGLADSTLKAHEAGLEKRLDKALAIEPDCPAGRKLRKVILSARQYLFVFVTVREVTATNNGSERALRPCAVYRKITNGFRAKWAADIFANVRSTVETARRRSVTTIDAIRITLQNQPILTPA